MRRWSASPARDRRTVLVIAIVAGQQSLGMTLLRADGVERAWRTLILILGRDPGGRAGNCRKSDFVERSRQSICRTLTDDSEIDLAGSRARDARHGRTQWGGGAIHINASAYAIVSSNNQMPIAVVDGAADR